MFLRGGQSTETEVCLCFLFLLLSACICQLYCCSVIGGAEMSLQEVARCITLGFKVNYSMNVCNAAFDTFINLKPGIL